MIGVPWPLAAMRVATDQRDRKHQTTSTKLQTSSKDQSPNEEKIPEPVYVLQKWADSIEKLDYRKYKECEAYPKDENVFRKMYGSYYMVDITAIEVDKLKEEDVRKNPAGESFIHRAVNFEGTAVKRETKKPYQVIRGDAVFVKFLDGNRKNDGWLMSNRTITRIDR